MTRVPAAASDPMFRPLTLGPLALSNRIVMAPMTRYFSPDDVPTEATAQYYARRARHDVGLIITEAAYIGHPSAHSYENVPRFYGEAALAGWKRVVDAVHAEGAR